MKLFSLNFDRWNGPENEEDPLFPCAQLNPKQFGYQMKGLD